MPSITVTGWNPGFRSISFIKLLHEKGNQKIDLKSAKDLVDQMIEGKSFILQLDTEHEVNEFLKAAIDVGAKASRIPEELNG